MIIKIIKDPAMTSTNQNLKQFLKKRGLKNSRKRELIFNTLLNNKNHLSVDEIYQQAKELDPHIGIATVFRTLKLLKSNELINEINIGDGKNRYEPSFKSPHHDHLICSRCGTVLEAVDPRIEKLQLELCKNNHFFPLSHRLEIFGICSACNNKKDCP